jgi:hypothetical protein
LAGSITTGFLNTLGRFFPKRLGGKFFYTIGGLSSNFWGERDYQSYINDFIEIPELNAVINYKARAKSRVNLQVVSKETNLPVKNNESLVKIIRKPNWFQTQSEWIFQSSLYRDIFGNEYHYFLRPVGMGNNYKALYTLPPQNVYIHCPVKKFFLHAEMPEEIKYYFKLDNEANSFELLEDDILHLNNNRVTYRPDQTESDSKLRTNYMYGTSKLASLTPALANLRIAHEGRNTLRRLPAGVFSNNFKGDVAGAVSFDPDEKDNLQGEMRKYGLSVDQHQLIITSLNLRLNETIVDIGKLKLYEETEEATSALCDAFGVPFELVGSKSDVTYENKKYAERQLYEDTVIPETIEWVSALNHKFDTDSKSWHIVGTFDHLPIFQENQQERANALNTTVTALYTALQAGAIDLAIFETELAKFGIQKGKK